MHKLHYVCMYIAMQTQLSDYSQSRLRPYRYKHRRLSTGLGDYSLVSYHLAIMHGQWHAFIYTPAR